jgi:hypothetical protein
VHRLVDAPLMLTIAQVSATFVAIVAGLYTSKILSISSEKQRIQNKIAEIDAEARQRHSIIDDYQSRIDPTFMKRASDDIEDFVTDLLSESDLKVYSLDELKTMFAEYEKPKQPNEYHTKVLTKEFENIKKRILKAIQERRSKDPSDLERQFGMGLGSIANQYGNVARIYDKDTVIREIDFINQNRQQQDEEYKRIRINNTLKEHYENELKTVIFPRHVTFGYLSQVGFAITGVALPLTHSIWSVSLGDYADAFGLGMFFAGLITMFVYIFSELWAALYGSKPSRQSTNKERAT